MNNIRLIVIPLGDHLIITVNKIASSTLIELIGEGNELFCDFAGLPDLLAANKDKKVVGLLREPYDRFASGLLEEVKRTIKLHVDLLGVNREELTRVAQSDDFWRSAVHAYFQIQGVCIPNWEHATMGYTDHCGNWLGVLDHVPDIKLVNMRDLNKFLSKLGYPDVPMHNKTSNMDYVVRLDVTVPDLNKRFAGVILPSINEYKTIRNHLESEIEIYNRLMQRASS